MKNNRKDYIDILKGVGILSVLLGHLLLPGNVLKIVLYSFHMPLFFMVVGMTYHIQPFKTVVGKRMNSLYVPYLLWALIFSSFDVRNLACILYGTNETLIQAGSNGMLWFLSAMFISIFIAAPVLNKYSYSKMRIFLLSIIMLIISMILKHFHGYVSWHDKVIGLPFAIDIAFMGASFILMGYIMPSLSQFTRKQLFLMSGGVFFSIFSIFNVPTKGYQQMATGEVGNILIFALLAVIVTYSLTCMSSLLSETKMCKTLCWFGKNSMVIFIAHRMIIYPIKDYCNENGSIYVFLVGFVILVAFSSFIARMVGIFFPFLAGKTNK